MKDYEKAGMIASRARDFGISLLKKDILIREVVEEIEHKIKVLGGEMGFPVNISINSMAAHDTADIGDDRRISEGDVVKIDVGVHINGFIADTAKTKEVGTNQYKKLIEATENALDAAIKLAKPGTMMWEIGQAIEDEITSLGFNPVRNLSGHELDKFDLHAGVTIPNYNNNDKTKLKEGQVIAIEPFATDGVGIVFDSGKPKILKFQKPSRVSRTISNQIKKKYGSLPFSKTWLEKTELFYLNSMIKEGSIRVYYPLMEKSGGIVTQTEHTVIVGKKPKVTTK